MKLTKGQIATAVVFLVLLLDQVLKIWIKTHMQLHENVEITSWFYIYFTENPGMAFGIELVDKLFLTLFRIVAVGFIGFFLYKQVQLKRSTGFITCVALILAGAAGNIVDSVFYGKLFDHSFGQVSSFLPETGGYADFMHGKVVDMFYFPLIESTFPSWLPIWGGEDFIFFRPIFNLADSAICVGVFSLVLFFRNTLSEALSNDKKD